MLFSLGGAEMTEPPGVLSFSEGLIRRIAGPFRFRFIAQPLIAIALGIWDGIGDAKAGRPPYLAGMLFAVEHRRELLKRSLQRLTMPFLIGVILDVVVQWLLFHRVIVLGAVVAGTSLVALPYAIARGLTNRMVRHHYRVSAAAARMGKNS
jgi:hypothetical protein